MIPLFTHHTGAHLSPARPPRLRALMRLARRRPAAPASVPPPAGAAPAARAQQPFEYAPFTRDELDGSAVPLAMPGRVETTLLADAEGGEP